ncbi:3-phosphoinositide dependent protein kinase-1 [Tritrichomonas musculus]|uniref:non-specific serine/threonine protein kinase n=1 Tax=Tritrichomonas musculus TaxID=1915356 RepID=A0ABR2JWE2_9EUKA
MSSEGYSSGYASDDDAPFQPPPPQEVPAENPSPEQEQIKEAEQSASTEAISSTDSNPVQNKPRQKRRDDFEIGKLLGEGAFGQVLEVVDKETKIHYAMKVLSKAHIIKEKKMPYVKVERDVMTKLHHFNVTRLLLTFQDPGNLYYVIEYAPNGDLQKVIDRIYTVDVPLAKITCGQILLGLAHIHQNRIIHRDLKPENILLDSQNRVKITDFGTSKIFGKDEPFQVERGSFVGSADYVSPETLLETPIGPSSDLWAFGCILYTLLVGESPFHTESNYATFQKIQNLQFTIPDFVPEDAKDLITKILVLDPEKRLGNGEYDDNYKSIREHPFFALIDWDNLPEQPVEEWRPFEPAIAARKESEHTETFQSQVPELLIMGEQSVFEGYIIKKRKLSSKKRLLVLTNKPRLFYVDMAKKEIKGSIPLTKETSVVVLKGKKWEINTPERRYDLTAENNTPDEWKQAIDGVLAKL